MGMEIEDLFKRLRPILGERVDALWLDYQLNPESRRELEGILRALAMKHLGASYETKNILLVPPSSDVAAGGYPLGSVVYPRLSPFMFGLREGEWIQHVGVFGRTGSGKTNVGFLMVKELLVHGKPVMIFDWKRNYRDLIALPWARDMRLFTVGREVAPFFFNPLIPPEGTLTSVWLKKLIEIMCHVYWLGEGVAYLLQKAIDSVYQSTRANAGSDPWPTLEDVRHWLESYKAKGREAQWMDSTIRVIGTLCYGMVGKVLNSSKSTPLELLLRQNVVLELDALTNSDKTFLIETMLLWIHHYRMQQPDREVFKHAILIEEAHHVLLKRQESKESVMDVVVREIRELGESLIIIDQHPSMISIPALGNTYCTIAMNLKHSRDVTSMGQATLIKEEEREYLGRLPVGQGIVKLQARWPNPFLVRFPHLEVKKGMVSDATLNQQYGVSGNSNGILPSQPMREEIPLIRAGDKNVDKMIEDKNRISEEEAEFVIDVMRHPCSGVAERYSRLGLSVSRGSRLLSSLLFSSFFSSCFVSTPSGRVRYLQLQKQAREWLRQRGFELPLQRGNEGPEHEYWKYRVAEHYKSLGFEVEVEKRLLNGHRVDVWARSDRGELALEIENDPQQALANVARCLGGAVSGIVIICVRPQHRPRMAQRLSKEIAAGTVRLKGADDF